MDNKKYYYLKLKDNFFESDEIVVLESMKDGYIYSNILLKLYLRSLKNSGRLMFKDNIPYNSAMIANLTRHSVGDVERAVKVLTELGLMEILDNGAIYMMDIQNFIGESSTEADRVRAYRRGIEKEKESIKSIENSTFVQMYDKCTPEIEIEIELERELEIDKDILSSKHDDASNDTPKEKRGSMIPYKEIIDYLNQTCGTNFKYQTKSTKEHINARWAEGYRLDDFKTVISKKLLDSRTYRKDGTPIFDQRYLRPQTLFGTKFEAYLNQPDKTPTKNQADRINQMGDTMLILERMKNNENR